MEFFEILTLVFFSTTVILLMFMWGVRSIVLRIFGSFKRWFLRNKGYGNYYIFESGRILRCYYDKMSTSDNTKEIDGKKYVIIPEKIFTDSNGIRSLIYAKNDTEPLDINEFDKSDNMIRSSSFWSNLANMIKMFAELKAMKSTALMMILLVLVLIGVGLTLGVLGYMYYSLDQGTLGAIIGV